MTTPTSTHQPLENSGSKAYHRPVLQRLGGVLDLTQNAPAGPGGDAGGFDADTSKAGS